MYYLWILHYSLVKGMYKKRWKEMTTSVDGLAFCCLFILSLFIFILFVDKALLWDVIRKRLPLGPLVRGGLIVLAPVLFFLLSRRLTQHRIKTIRKVIKVKRKIKRGFSILYISAYISIFIFTLVLIALSRTPM
jgi:hypothetical protein